MTMMNIAVHSIHLPITMEPTFEKAGGCLQPPRLAGVPGGYLQLHGGEWHWSPYLQSLYLSPILIQEQVRFQPHSVNKEPAGYGSGMGGLNPRQPQYRIISRRRLINRMRYGKLHLAGLCK